MLIFLLRHFQRYRLNEQTIISKIMLLFFDVQKEVIFSQSNSKLTAVEGGGWE